MFERKKIFLLLEKKLKEKIPDPRNAKRRHQSFIKKEKHKTSKRTKNSYSVTEKF